jgi:hypothetical protein
MDNTFRVLNGLVNRQVQRDRIKHSLQNNIQLPDARYDGFFLQQEQVFTTLPSGEEVELLMTPADVQEKLREEFAKPENAQNNLYWGLRYKYLNLTRKAAKEFLKGQETYVLSQPAKARVNKSVVANVKLPDELWAIDLVEFGQQYEEANTVVENVMADGASTRGKLVPAELALLIVSRAVLV